MSSLEKTGPLRSSFKAPQMRCIPHDLEAGNSMLVSYPGSKLGHSVFLMTDINMEDNTYAAIMVNGAAQTTLKTVVQQTLEEGLDVEQDIPVFAGGGINPRNVAILTPLDWHPELDSAEVGPFRIHMTLHALRLLATGDIPDRIRIVAGNMQGSMTDFTAALQHDVLGEIVTDDDLVFRAYDPETKWARAMYLHTGGKTLTIPPAYTMTSLTDMPDAPAVEPPRYVM